MDSRSNFIRFLNREDAGRRLARVVAERGYSAPVVIGMARGGVPVAAQVARELGAPLDIAVVRKVGAPDQPELAIGAIAEGEATAVDTHDAVRLGLDEQAVAAVVRKERQELQRRVDAYRSECPALPLDGRTAILVDDGIATGHTAIAAARSLYGRGAARIVLAVPVCPAEYAAAPLAPPIDELVYVTAPRDMLAVGYWYADFPQVGDDELLSLLRAARPTDNVVAPDPSADPSADPRPPAGDLPDDPRSGSLVVPMSARGVVVFAHGSGSSRFSTRNQMVARRLNEAGFATLLFDLLTDEEARDRARVFDIALLADRLRLAAERLREHPDIGDLPLGIFGASTGGGAALAAAADPALDVRAVVSRGGRPDMAAESLPLVTAPTLLIVGEADTAVIALNREAMSRMTCPVELTLVPAAGHLFEGPGQLEKVAELAAEWFARHLTSAPV